MLTGVQWLCDCGKPFALAPRAFHEGMVCPLCGTEVTPKDLLPHRPHDVSRGMYWQSLWILFLLTTAQMGLIGRPYAFRSSHELARVFEDLGRSLPRVSSLALRSDVVLPICAVMELSALGLLVWGCMRRRRDLRPAGALLALMTLSIVLGLTLGIAIRMPLVDLIRSLN